MDMLLYNGNVRVHKIVACPDDRTIIFCLFVEMPILYYIIMCKNKNTIWLPVSQILRITAQNSPSDSFFFYSSPDSKNFPAISLRPARAANKSRVLRVFCLNLYSHIHTHARACMRIIVHMHVHARNLSSCQ